MVFSRYLKIYPYENAADSVIMFSTKKASAIVIPESMLKDIEAGNISEEEKQALFELGFLVSDAEDEKKEMLKYIDELNSINKTFRAIVVMNLDCNLACRYCFEGTRKGKHYMSRETADGTVKFAENKIAGGSIEDINLIFYGGEPLLSTERIIYISERLKNAAEKEGIKYGFSFITNGTLLTLKTAQRLKPFGLKSASVTLDGTKEIHDYFRPFSTGKGSFDTIIRNLKETFDIVDIQIGGNFTRENYREFPGLLDYLLNNELTPEKISSVRFDPVSKESPEFALPDFCEGCETLNEPWLFEAGIFLREEVLKRGYKTDKVSPDVCMVEFKDNMVINYNGDICKCPGLIGREEFKIGDIKTEIEDYGRSHDLDNWKNEECLSCSYLPLCFGGCRYMKLVRDGNMNGADCKKEFLDATLEALVMQDVRYRTTSKL